GRGHQRGAIESGGEALIQEPSSHPGQSPAGLIARETPIQDRRPLAVHCCAGQSSKTTDLAEATNEKLTGQAGERGLTPCHSAAAQGVPVYNERPPRPEGVKRRRPSNNFNSEAEALAVAVSSNGQLASTYLGVWPGRPVQWDQSFA